MTARSGSKGYILFLVATIVAILSLLTLMAARVQTQMSGPVAGLREQASLELAAQSVSAHVAYLLATQPLGPRSILIGADQSSQTPDGAAPARSVSGAKITELMLDASPYLWAAGSRGYVVSVQDETGLLNLDAGDEIGTLNLLISYGLNGGAAQQLAASLADFVDQDDVRRRGGAESRDYQSLGLSPPPNGALNSPHEALSALGWRETLPPSMREAVFSATRSGGQGNALNVNTAPVAALEAAFNLSERNAQQIVTRRNGAPFRAADEVRAFTGETPRAEAPTPTTMPGNAFRVRVSPAGRGARAGYAYEMQLTFGGDRSDRPVYGRNGWLGRSLASAGREETRELLAFPDAAALSAP